jgi:hypothetical protein
VLKVMMVPKVLQEKLDNEVIKVQKESVVYKDIRVQPVHKEQQDRMEV